MNHTISPALTNMMNYFGGSMYANKTSGIVTYSAGMWGGARCGVALRAYLSELGCLPVSATAQLARAWRPGTFEAETGRLPEDCMGAKLTERMLDQMSGTHEQCALHVVEMRKMLDWILDDTSDV